MNHFVYYDVESLPNVFTTAVWEPSRKRILFFYLVDDSKLIDENKYPEIIEEVRARNKNLPADADFQFYNLSTQEGAEAMAQYFGVCDASLVNNPKSRSSFPARFRMVCDTDPYFDAERYPYLVGYNSFHYDTVMLAWLFYRLFPIRDGKADFQPISADEMRAFNDELFSSQYRNNMTARLRLDKDGKDQGWFFTPNMIRRSFQLSGRYIDAVRMNEKQMHTGLKRLAGLMGHQIKEYEGLDDDQAIITDPAVFASLCAYNISDVLSLYELFQEPFYQSNFDMKAQLLRDYPDTVYQKKADAFAPDVQPASVSIRRLLPDSTSAAFVSRILAPYSPLKDIDSISFLYPSKERADQLGIEQKDVLEETKKAFYQWFEQPELRQEFDRIYEYYSLLRGKSINDSEQYQKDYPLSVRSQIPFLSLEDLPAGNLGMELYDKTGQSSGCYVVMGAGGVHGAEYDLALYQQDLLEYEKLVQAMKAVQSQYSDPKDLKKAKQFIDADGTVYKASAFLKTSKGVLKWKDLAKEKPGLFTAKTNGVMLNERYHKTSSGITSHEDFVSYYPGLLINLQAFTNPDLGEDRYARLLENKQIFGQKMNDQSLSAPEKNRYKLMREGTKLLLNAASGAADTQNRSPIRMNNRILSMRIIGQLLSYRLAQAQTLEGARIVSSNTDGLYSIMDAAQNRAILEQETRDIHVQIEPERTGLISKDTNTRLEFDADQKQITSVAGAYLVSANGPDVTRSLNHPAIVDLVLSRYLMLGADDPDFLARPFDRNLAREILEAFMAEKKNEPAVLLRYFQNILAGSAASTPFAIDQQDQAHLLQRYNRIFIMKDASAQTVHLQAAAIAAITPASQKKRQREHLPAQNHHPQALNILSRRNPDILAALPENREITLRKITGVSPEWNIEIENGSLFTMDSVRQKELLEGLDLEVYLDLVETAFQPWKNRTSSISKPVSEETITLF